MVRINKTIDIHYVYCRTLKYSWSLWQNIFFWIMSKYLTFLNLICNFRYHWYWFLPLPTFNQMVMAITDTMVTKTTTIIDPTTPMSASPQAMTLLLLNPVMALPHPLLAMALPLPNPAMTLLPLAMTLLQLVTILLQQVWERPKRYLQKYQIKPDVLYGRSVCSFTDSAIISNLSSQLGKFGTRVWRNFYLSFTQTIFCKVHIFWEGHKILRNLTFDLCTVVKS